ncbi:hypothetical protein D6C86_03583 [Aureobasidium pullulans]|nr:hypothetical protein D6C86_03583 [Aureobasidium pullulans]
MEFHSFKSSLPGASLDLPEIANSTEGLEFIGFDPKFAAHIFRTYDKYKAVESDPDEFFTFVHGHIIQITSAAFSGPSERSSMTKIGICQEVQDAILDPAFVDIYNTETLLFWIEDTLRANYSNLRLLLGRLHDQGNIELAKKSKKKKKRAKLESAFPAASASAQEETGLEEDIAAVTLSSESAENLFKHCVVVETPPKILDNHTILWKGKVSSELVAHEAPFFMENGALNMLHLNSRAGGDFNSQQEVHYWTTEKETAEQYRKYAARRSPLVETWMIRIQVPNEFLGSLPTENLYYSRDWKEYVWYCKNKDVIPEKFHHLSEKAHLIKGHICKKPTVLIQRMKSQEVQDQITKGDLMYNDNSKATQWVFMKAETISRLAEEIKGKVYVEITGPLMEI